MARRRNLSAEPPTEAAPRGTHPGAHRPERSDAELQRRIQERAYELFQARRGQGGSDVEDWLQAEREVLAEPAPRIETRTAAARKGSFAT